MTISELARLIQAEGNKVDEALIPDGPAPAPSVLPAPFAKETDVTKVGPKEAALRAARDDDLSIPAALDRTKGMTKEDFAKLHDKLSKPTKDRSGTKLKIVPTPKPSTLTDADKRAIAELKKTEKQKADAKKAEGLAKLKAAQAEKKAIREAAKKAKSVPLAKIGETEAGKANAESWNAIPAVAKAGKKAAGASKPPKAPPNAAKAAKPTSEPRKGSKTALIGELLSRQEGCTTADVLKATGWPAVSMPQQAKALGVSLRKEKKQGEVTRYWAA